MADEFDQGEKTEEPSAHRIEEFRKRGEVASSKELSNVLVLTGCVLTLTLSMAYVYGEMTAFIEWAYRLDVATAFTEKSLKTIASHTFYTALKCSAPIFFTALSIGVMGNVVQIGWLFAPEVLSFKPERINPINGIGRLFSMNSLLEAIKGVLKFIVIMVIVYMVIKDDLDSYRGFFHLDIYQSFVHGQGMIAKVSFFILLGMMIVAAGDFAYQKVTYHRKLMMTKYEAKREQKEQDGSPEVKQRIKTIQREMAQKRMIAEIPKADVIVTNPTHLSVALKYDIKNMVSPEVIGKGADLMAMRIREIAKEHNIPIVENVPLARTLYNTVEVGTAVPRALYKAIAEILAFVYKLKKKEKALR